MTLPARRINQTPVLASSMHQPVELMALADYNVDYVRECAGFNDPKKPGLSMYPIDLRDVMYRISLMAARTVLEYVDDGSGDEFELLEMGNSELEFIDWFVDEVEHPERYL